MTQRWLPMSSVHAKLIPQCSTWQSDFNDCRFKTFAAFRCVGNRTRFHKWSYEFHERIAWCRSRWLSCDFAAKDVKLIPIVFSFLDSIEMTERMWVYLIVYLNVFETFWDILASVKSITRISRRKFNHDFEEVQQWRWILSVHCLRMFEDVGASPHIWHVDDTI